MNFIFEWKTIFYERAQRVSKIMFLAREDKIHILEPQCNVLSIIQTRVFYWKTYRNYVIDKLTCEIMENKPLGSRMQFL